MKVETIPDIVQFIREELPTKMEGLSKGELLVLDTAKLADRIEAAHEHELMAEKAKAAAEGYAEGQRSACTPY